MNTESTPKPQTPPTVLVIFGASGNLASTKLLPALYQLLAYDHLPSSFQVVAVFRQSSTPLNGVMKNVTRALESSGYICNPEILSRLHDIITPITMDSTNQADYERLRELLDSLDETSSQAHQRMFYLAVPPNIFTPVINCLAGAKLNDDTEGIARRIFVEKPFGSDLNSARDLIEHMRQHFREDQIYRIDHYLAKETAQNILTFRFKNPLIRHIWSREGIDSITVRALERIDIEGRADFYEHMGALRDLIQNHLIQLAALTLMETPSTLTSEEIHAQKIALLNAMRLPAEPTEDVVQLGQYIGYPEEVHNPSSRVETYARVRLEVDLPSWHGVPITLETGKALDKKLTEIEVVFRDRQQLDDVENKLIIRLQPNEGIELRLLAKTPGFATAVESVAMDFTYESTFSGSSPAAYERVIYDAILGDQTLFASSAEVLRSWEIIQPIISAQQDESIAIQKYQKGSTGPIDHL